MNPIIKVENVSKTFHAKSGEVDALQNIDLEIVKVISMGLSDCPVRERVRWFAV